MMNTLQSAISAGAPALTLSFTYDYMGRRVSKTVTNGSTSTTETTLYQGWNPVDTFSGGVLTKTLLWGLDLSGTLQGAGGVGGLLAVNVLGSNPATYFPSYDTNGNIITWTDGTGTLVRRMDYDPFGNTLIKETYVTTPGLDAALTYGFSTKPADPETGLIYYGYRYYDPVNGRWTSRDPIGEYGGINLYGFVGNDGVNRLDRLGQDFIGVGRTNYYLFGSIPLHHAIVQYWKTCKTAGNLNSWTTVEELKKKGLSDLTIKASTELTPDKGVNGKGYRSWVTFASGSNTTIGKLYTGLWISYISNVPNVGDKLAVVYEGTDSEVAAKWKKIMAASSSYGFAEQTKGATAKFPQSIYGSPEYSRPAGGTDFQSPIPFNNSNTFARHVLSQAAIDWKVITICDFPGNTSPEAVIGKWENATAN